VRNIDSNADNILFVFAGAFQRQRRRVSRPRRIGSRSSLYREDTTNRQLQHDPISRQLQHADEKDELTKRNIQLQLKLLHAEFEKLNLQCMELNVSHVRFGHLNDDIDDLLDIVHDSSAKLEDDVSIPEILRILLEKHDQSSKLSDIHAALTTLTQNHDKHMAANQHHNDKTVILVQTMQTALSNQTNILQNISTQLANISNVSSSHIVCKPCIFCEECVCENDDNRANETNTTGSFESTIVQRYNEKEKLDAQKLELMEAIWKQRKSEYTVEQLDTDYHMLQLLAEKSCTSHPGVLGSIPKREEPRKTGAPCVKVPGSSRVPVRDGQTSPHRPRLVVSRSTCPPLSSPPPTRTALY